MLGITSTIGYLESLKYTKIIDLKKESYLSKMIKEQWNKDKEQITHGYKNGTERTQHGVNAEYFHTAQKNVEELRKAAAEGRAPNLMMKSPFVNGPDDLIQGNKVLQMKFYRDINGSLTGCMEHLNKYADSYTHNDNALYVIPPEQYQQLLDIKQGLIPEGMSANQAQSLRQKIARFESIKGNTIEETMEPGAITYEEAQLKNIAAKTQDVETTTEKTHKEEVDKIEKSTDPSVKGALKGAFIAAGISMSITAALHIYDDFSKGKNIFKGGYGSKDYQRLLKAVGANGGKAGMGSLLYYGLTTLFKKRLFAVSFTTNLIKGITQLKAAYTKDKIKFTEFVNLSLTLAVTAAVDAIGEAGIAALVGVGLSALATSGVALPMALSMVAAMISTMLLSSVYGLIIAWCKDLMVADIKAMVAEHQKILKDTSAAFGCSLARLRDEFLIFATDAKTMDNRNNDYQARVEACNRLSRTYGTSEIDPNESIASLKARFLK